MVFVLALLLVQYYPNINLNFVFPIIHEINKEEDIEKINSINGKKNSCMLAYFSTKEEDKMIQIMM